MQVGGFQHCDIGAQAIRQWLGAGLFDRVGLAGASSQKKGGNEGSKAGVAGHGEGRER
jgi:hypothetical protein